MISTHLGEICGITIRSSTHLWKHYLLDLLDADRIRSLKELTESASCQEIWQMPGGIIGKWGVGELNS